jgi:Zn-dependent protease
MDELSLIQRISAWLVPLLFAITVHEVAHGAVAQWLGDPTAKMMGRLTLNPFKHIDPVGTVLVPGVLLVLGGVIFGWAKPVPVDYRNLRRPRRDMALVALAGPGANLAMGMVWALVIKLGVHYHEVLGAFGAPLVLMGIAGIFANTILLVLNLIPLPPLDGGRVLVGILPRGAAAAVSRIEPFGLIILLALLLSGLLGHVLSPAVGLVQSLLANVAGVPPPVFGTALHALLGGH